MFLHTVHLVPVRHRRVGVFFAPDPVHDHADTEFNIETYRLLPQGTTIVRPGLATVAGHDRFAIKSEIDGEPRFLPEVLAFLWGNREVPAEALPELHAQLAGDFSRPRDFEPILARRARHRWLRLVALAACVALAAVFVWMVYGPGNVAPSAGDGRLEELELTGAEWLAQPMRPHAFLSSADDPLPALAVVPLGAAGYAPPAARFDVPPDPAGAGYALARIQAADERRLVLVSGEEMSLLPRVSLNGAVIPAADLDLPEAALANAAGGDAQALNTTLVLCNHVVPRQKAAATGMTWELAGWLVIVFGIVLVTPFTIVVIVLWRRQVKRERQLRTLRQRLGLPDPALTPQPVSP